MRRALFLLLSTGCYAHGAAHTGGIPTRSTTIPAITGVYEITRDGTRIGEERFTVTSSQAIWRARGTVTLTAPAESTHGYELEIDRRLAAPIHFVVWVELYGERRTAEGWLTEDGFFDVEASGIGGRRKKRLPYGPGTALAFDSPIFSAVVLARTVLEDLRPVTVRTIDLALPVLDPSVLTTTYERVGAKEGLAHVTAKRTRTNQVVALWVRDDGLVIRSRRRVGRAVLEHALQ